MYAEHCLLECMAIRGSVCDGTLELSTITYQISIYQCGTHVLGLSFKHLNRPRTN